MHVYPILPFFTLFAPISHFYLLLEVKFRIGGTRVLSSHVDCQIWWREPRDSLLFYSFELIIAHTILMSASHIS